MRQDLRQLDEEWRRVRPHRATQGVAAEIVEFVASDPRLQPAGLISTGGARLLYCFATN
jgi:hypothetical protein